MYQDSITMTSGFYQLGWLDKFDYSKNSKKKQLKKFCEKARNILLNNVDTNDNINKCKTVEDILKLFTGAEIKSDHKICMYKYIDGIFNYNVRFVICNVMFDKNKVKCVKNILTYHCSSYYDSNNKKTLMNFYSFIFLNCLYKLLKRTTQPTKINFADEYYCENENIVRSKKLFDININWEKICTEIYNETHINELLTKENNGLEKIGVLNEKLSFYNTINIIEKQNRLQYLTMLLLSLKEPDDDLIGEYCKLKKELCEYNENHQYKIQQQLAELTNDAIDIHKKITKLEYFKA